MKNVIVITEASSGFGSLAAHALAIAGHTVYASMRETTGRNAVQVEAAQKFAAENKVHLRTIELDVASQESADQAIKTIVEKDGRLDVVIHNAGHMVFGAAEAFTPEQLMQVASTALHSHNCASRKMDWFSGSEAPAHAEALRHTSHLTSRQRRLWTRLLSAMPQS